MEEIVNDAIFFFLIHKNYSSCDRLSSIRSMISLLIVPSPFFIRSRSCFCVMIIHVVSSSACIVAVRTSSLRRAISPNIFPSSITPRISLSIITLTDPDSIIYHFLLEGSPCIRIYSPDENDSLGALAIIASMVFDGISLKICSSYVVISVH